MDDLVQQLKAAGFVPKENRDEENPTLKGEYRVIVDELTPSYDKETKELTAYRAKYLVAETLSGEAPAGKHAFTRWYNIAGTKYDGTPITQEDAGKQIMRMIEDIKTCGVDLWEGAENMLDVEANFPKAIGAVAYVRAYRKPKDDNPAEFNQIFKVKTEKDLRKESKGEAARPTVGF